MNESSDSKIKRLSELPQEIAPPHDTWPALQGRLRETLAQPRRAHMQHVALVATVLAAVVVGVYISRGRHSRVRPLPLAAAAPFLGASGPGLAVGRISDARFLRERAALLYSLNARLATRPPPTRRKVLRSLAIIDHSIVTIQRALGREPGNALLQALLIDTYQNQMRVLLSAQRFNGTAGETRT